jgi:hypothetical protein
VRTDQKIALEALRAKGAGAGQPPGGGTQGRAADVPGGVHGPQPAGPPAHPSRVEPLPEEEDDVRDETIQISLRLPKSHWSALRRMAAERTVAAADRGDHRTVTGQQIILRLIRAAVAKQEDSHG